MMETVVVCPICKSELAISMEVVSAKIRTTDPEMVKAAMTRPADNAENTPSTSKEEYQPEASATRSKTDHLMDSGDAKNQIGYHEYVGGFECSTCGDTFEKEWSCWQHVVSKDKCHEKPEVAKAVEDHLKKTESTKKQKKDDA